jgi:hypothetical protein
MLLKSMEGRVLLVRQLSPGKNKVNVGHLSAGTYILVTDKEVVKVVIN